MWRGEPRRLESGQQPRSRPTARGANGSGPPSPRDLAVGETRTRPAARGCYVSSGAPGGPGLLRELGRARRPSRSLRPRDPRTALGDSPFADAGVVTGEEHLGDLPAAPLRRPRVVGVFGGALERRREGLLDRRGLVAQRSG